jgi:hypothetical protein
MRISKSLPQSSENSCQSDTDQGPSGKVAAAGPALGDGAGLLPIDPELDYLPAIGAIARSTVRPDAQPARPVPSRFRRLVV